MYVYSKKESGGTGNAPLSNVLFEKIQRDILSGEMKSGEKLTEQKICDRYKVSRTPVREALRQLEREGLVENIPNRGAFVIGISPQEMDDLMMLRTEYEVVAARWAAARIQKDELEKLEETFDFMEFYTNKGDMDRMASINLNFHKSIYAAAHSRMLEQTLNSYRLYVKYGSHSSYDNSQEYLDTLLEEHRAIFEAIRSRDETAAMNAMRAHMEASFERRIQSR